MIHKLFLIVLFSTTLFSNPEANSSVPIFRGGGVTLLSNPKPPVEKAYHSAKWSFYVNAPNNFGCTGFYFWMDANEVYYFHYVHDDRVITSSGYHGFCFKTLKGKMTKEQLVTLKKFIETLKIMKENKLKKTQNYGAMSLMKSIDFSLLEDEKTKKFRFYCHYETLCNKDIFNFYKFIKSFYK